MIGFVFLFCLLFRWGHAQGATGSCIQVVSFVWVLTIWYFLGLVLGPWSQCSHPKGSGLDLYCLQLVAVVLISWWMKRTRGFARSSSGEHWEGPEPCPACIWGPQEWPSWRNFTGPWLCKRLAEPHCAWEPESEDHMKCLVTNNVLMFNILMPNCPRQTLLYFKNTILK